MHQGTVASKEFLLAFSLRRHSLHDAAPSKMLNRSTAQCNKLTLYKYGRKCLSHFRLCKDVQRARSLASVASAKRSLEETAYNTLRALHSLQLPMTDSSLCGTRWYKYAQCQVPFLPFHIRPRQCGLSPHVLCPESRVAHYMRYHENFTGSTAAASAGPASVASPLSSGAQMASVEICGQALHRPQSPSERK